MSIDIIIPVYNAGETLERCLQSVLAQSVTDWRVLMADDVSSDNSREIMERYAAQDPRFVCLYNEVNGGVSAARNRALAELKGTYTAFLDSDDWWDPNILSILLEALETENADIASCEYKVNYADGREADDEGLFPTRTVIGADQNGILLEKMLTGITMNHIWGKLIRSELLEGIRFDTDLKTAEDMLVHFQMLLRCRRYVCLPDRLYHYYRADSGLTHGSLSVARKWRDNRRVSDRITALLPGTPYNTAKYKTLAFLRPYRITVPKLLRMIRDKGK